MAVQVSYPGVYIEEFAPGAPIQGVSTNIAAFIGLAAKGEMDQPVKITSWDRFVELYGDQPVSSSMLWFAVRGFFDNGGQTCYIVRASNGDYRKGDLMNRANDSAKAIVRLKARNPGRTVPPTSIEITESSLLNGAQLFQPEGSTTSIVGRTMTMTSDTEAGQFRPGDWLDVSGRRVQVARVSGEEITLTSDPGVTSPADVRLADLRPSDQTLRIEPPGSLPPGSLVPGTVLVIPHNGKDEIRVVDTVQAEYLPAPQGSPQKVTYRVGLRQELGFAVTGQVGVRSLEVDVKVLSNGSGPTYTGLGLDAKHDRYYVDLINRSDSTILLEPVEPAPPAPFVDNLPAIGQTDLAPGVDETLATINDKDYIEALDTLRHIDEVSLVAIPGVTSPAVQQAMIAHCELMADRFAILDSIPGAGMFGTGSVEEQRRSVDSTRGYAALYYPWLKMTSPLTGKEVLVPPSGHICGIIAQTDNTRGVHKAPANVTVNSAVAVQTTMNNQEQGLLNLQGINVIRIFQNGGRPIVWGARTTATDRNWQYINIRRLFLFLEESIQENIQWAVFEPNNLDLWRKLKRTITEFLTRVWKDGALFGETADKAFYVRIDESLNPFSEQALGRLNIEVGVRPSYPAEFIIVRIGIWPGGSEISE